ncbi:membrane-spanning 4-domains subfamily A member 4D-like isoform X1 [Pelobates fuscus]|uniref:membrane-spanning 4-domains subfamily A member 4D-like isoform X1 n=1 Tax=Pelobates fuscus TaxID=191477 RepID=UPI002FE4938E
MDTTSGQLPEEWKAEFLKMKPIIPAILQLVTALVIIIFGCFGEVHIATPWWAGILFILSGTSFCFLFIWPLVTLEIFSLVTVVISILASVAAIIIYAVEFSIPQLFPHYNSNVLSYQVDVTMLALCAFELGISAWILTFLIILRRTAL